MKRNILSTLLVLFILFSVSSIPVFAVGDVTQDNLSNYYEKLNAHSVNLSLADFLEVAPYAYLDIDSASEEMKKKITDSREKIILNTTWSVDDLCWTYDDNGERVDLPDFYDIFPADWELPKEEIDNTELPEFVECVI